MFSDWSHCIRPNPPASCSGVSVADLLGVGVGQFVVCGSEGPNRVFTWVNGALADRTPRALADDGRATVAATAADVDGDGLEELYVLNADTFTGPTRHADRLFHRSADGRWHDLFADPTNAAARNATSGRSVAAVDRRGSGRYGFFVARSGQPMRFIERTAEGHLADLAPALGMDACTVGRSLWVGPLASDRPDLFCGNERGPNFLYRNTSCGTFLEIASAVHLTDAAEHARGVVGLDADGDGHFDLAIANWDGPNRLMIRQPDGTFHDRATAAMAYPGPVRTLIAADFDNDGYEELFYHCLGEPNRLFRREVDGTRPLEWVMGDVGDAAEPDGYGTGAAVADIDGDGRLELLLAHGERAPQPLSLFKVESGDNHWLRVRPLTRFGAPARGAVVRLRAGGRTLVRVIDGGSGYLCQMEPVAHFGLGAVATVDEVRVTWPDGATATVSGPRVRRTFEVAYPR